MSNSCRQTLLWEAIKARKANMIESSSLETIKKLVREPDTKEVNEKIENFYQQFVKRLNVGNNSNKVRSPDQSRIVLESSFEKLIPIPIIQKISSYLSMDEAVNLSQISFHFCSTVFPSFLWPKKIREHLFSVRALSDSDLPEDLIKKVVSVLEDPSLFSIVKDRIGCLKQNVLGVRILRLTNEDDIANLIMLRYLYEKICSGVFYLSTSVLLKVGRGSRPFISSGEHLNLSHAYIENMNLCLLFNSSFPVVVSEQSKVSLHGLESDRRTISTVASWTLVRSHEGFKLINPLISSQGTIFITIPGERSTRWLGKVLFNDEYNFQVEVGSSAQGSHGQGSHEVRGVSENLVRQTSRLVFKSPGGYFEISSKGLKLVIDPKLLFNHCV